MKRQIIIFLIFILIGVVNSFAYVSNLINNDNIVDIGKVKPSENSVKKISKIPILTNPNLKQVPALVLNSERNIKNQATCVTDFLGHENCPNDMITCNSKIEYSNGYAQAHTKIVKLPKHYIYSHSNVALSKSASAVAGATVSQTLQCETGQPIDIKVFTEDLNFKINISNAKTGKTYYNANQVEVVDPGYDSKVNTFEVKIPYNSYFKNAKSTLDGKKKFKYVIVNKGIKIHYDKSAKFNTPVLVKVWVKEAGRAGSKKMGYSIKCFHKSVKKYCSYNYFKDDPKNPDNTCYNKYTYYTYSCPTDKNIYNKQWTGPHIATGGDCLGECGSYGCKCNSSTPPAKNCVRTNFICPVDKTKTCSLVPSSNPTSGVDNYKDNYIYALGNSIKHTRTITTDMTCPINWTLNKEKSICEETPNYKCSLNGFTYDKEKGKCVQITKCESGVKDPVTNKCLYKPNYKCKDSGYIYDEVLGKCKRPPYCDKGTFDIVSNKCKDSAKNVCPKDYTLNTIRHRCEKPMKDLINFTEHTGRLWVGKIGDNYLQGHCKIDNFYSKFKVNDKNLIEYFKVNYAKFDDYIGVVLNGKYTYVGPYGGNTLYVKKGKVVYTTGGKTGKCELKTSWSKSLDKDAKYALRNGVNNIDVKVEVTGGGEGYASFKFKFKGRNTIQCLDSKYCSVKYSNNCPSGYSYDNANDICYKDKPHANEDLINQVYWVNPVCSSSGIFDNSKNQCVYNASCPGDDSSVSFDKNNHVCTETVNPECEQNQDLITTTVAGFSKACINKIQCPHGSYLDSNNICSQEGNPTCPYGTNYNEKMKKCVQQAFCPTGYKIKDSKCVKDYSFYNYTCPSGWDKPVESGFDCKGNCGIWGCECNTQTPPANNCRKKTNQSYANAIVQKRPLIKHQVTGTLSPEEFGIKKDYKCGENCKYTVTKIIGQNNQLCFFKRNGQIGCFTVDGCMFKGVIDNGQFPITELQIGKPESTKNYSHYISLPHINKTLIAPDKDISCYANNMAFNTHSRYCEGTSNKINFKSGKWTMAGEDANWHILNNYTIEQTKNSSDPALLVSPFELGEGGTFQGDLKVTDTGDNDWIGLVFGFKDKDNYYYVSWTKNSDDWHPYAGFEFGEMKNGKKIILSMAAKNTGGWSPNKTYTLKIKYGPKYMYLYKNGKLILNYKNDNFKPKGGRVGFYNWSQRYVYFSNFKTISYPKCPSNYSYNERLGQCLKVESIPTQYIESTCNMYGHVGGIWVKNGIVSAVVDKDAKLNPLKDLYRENNIQDYNLNYYDPAQRIDFWDSYQDHYLGFIEFLKTVKPEDSKDKYKVKNPEVFAIAGNGFTAISPIGSYTYYVSSDKEGYGNMTAEKCQQIADKYNLTVVNQKNSGEIFLKISKFLTGNEIKGSTENPQCLYGNFDANIKKCINIPKGKPNVPICLHGKLNSAANMCIITPRCVLKDTHNIKDINKDDDAYRTIYSNKKQVFKCSKWTCKDHQCAKANCPSGYSGNLHNYFEVVGDNKCQSNVCDAMLPYYDFCGKKGPCPTGQEYISEDGKCFQLSCPKGSNFDPAKQKCVKSVCPPNTKISKDGIYCVKI